MITLFSPPPQSGLNVTTRKHPRYKSDALCQPLVELIDAPLVVTTPQRVERYKKEDIQEARQGDGVCKDVGQGSLGSLGAPLVVVAVPLWIKRCSKHSF